MGIDVKITPETIMFCATIIFLIVELVVVMITIGAILSQIYSQQSTLTGMIAAHPTDASIYLWEGLENQGVNIVIGVVILAFLAYIGKEPIKKIKLVKDILRKK